jgi:DNA-binding transcriptional LysR family regulator
MFNNLRGVVGFNVGTLLMTLNVRELRAFLSIVDRGSLGRAAGAMCITQPGLSRIIKDMEGRLGTKLFDRQTRGMVLTESGEALLPHARLILFELLQATEAVDAIRGLRGGRVRIGAVATIARSIVPLAIAQLVMKEPGLRVELIEAVEDQLLAALIHREIDLAIAAPLPTTDDIAAVAECLHTDRYHVFCAATHPLASRRKLTLAELLAQRWVMPGAGARPRELFEEVIRNAGHTMPEIVVETRSPSVIAAVVAATPLLGWLPYPLVSTEEAAGRVKVLKVPQLTITRRFTVYRRRRGLLSEPALRLLRELRTVAT